MSCAWGQRLLPFATARTSRARAKEVCGGQFTFFRLPASSLIPIWQPYDIKTSFKYPRLPPPLRPIYPRDGHVSHPLALADLRPDFRMSLCSIAQGGQPLPVTLPPLVDILGSNQTHGHHDEMDLLMDLRPRFDFPPGVIWGSSDHRPQIHKPQPSDLGWGCPPYNCSIRRRSPWIRTPEGHPARSLGNEPAPRTLPQPVCLFHFQPLPQRLTGCPPWQRTLGSPWCETVPGSRKRARQDEDLPEVDDWRAKVIQLPNDKWLNVEHDSLTSASGFICKHILAVVGSPRNCLNTIWNLILKEAGRERWVGHRGSQICNCTCTYLTYIIDHIQPHAGVNQGFSATEHIL